jgi:hypothetical protein
MYLQQTPDNSFVHIKLIGIAFGSENIFSQLYHALEVGQWHGEVV